MSEHNAILMTLDKQRLPGGIQAAVHALDEGQGLISVGTDLFEYSSPSAALAAWFDWLFDACEQSQSKPSLTFGGTYL